MIEVKQQTFEVILDELKDTIKHIDSLNTRKDVLKSNTKTYYLESMTSEGLELEIRRLQRKVSHLVNRLSKVLEED